MKTEYVIVLARDCLSVTPRLVVVLKDRPPWQKGRINLPGGHVEPGETPIEAAVRELKEETGLEPDEAYKPCLMGRIEGEQHIVHCVEVMTSGEINPREGETESFGWSLMDSLMNHKLLMPNLNVIIPIMFAGVMDWVVHDEGVDWSKDRHDFAITVKNR